MWVLAFSCQHYRRRGTWCTDGDGCTQSRWAPRSLPSICTIPADIANYDGGGQYLLLIGRIGLPLDPYSNRHQLRLWTVALDGILSLRMHASCEDFSLVDTIRLVKSICSVSNTYSCTGSQIEGYRGIDTRRAARVITSSLHRNYGALHVQNAYKMYAQYKR